MWKVDCIHMLIFNSVWGREGGAVRVPNTLCKGQLYYFFCHVLIFLQSLTALVHFLSLQVVVVYFVQSLQVLSAGEGQSVGVLPC